MSRFAQHVLIGLAGFLTPIAAAQNPAAPPPPPAAAPAADALHWAQKIGWRVEQVNRAVPIVDRVVLVPDAATYLNEISKWSPRGRWPVLIEDDRYASMFIRRFAPAQVIRRESVDAIEADRGLLQKSIEAVVIRAWGGDPAQQTIRQTFEARGHVPPGVVITTTADHAWPAGVALAAGHGQPLVFLDGDFATANGAPSEPEVRAFAQSVETQIAALGYSYAALGDDIDTITFCRQLGGRMRVQTPGNPKIDYVAITDVLGRKADNTRFAFVGMIFGSETRSAYVAMCSLFLPRERAWLCNAYPTDVQPWSLYDARLAQQFLQQQGYSANVVGGSNITSRGWLSLLPGGVSADLVFVNTKGNVDFFEMIPKNDWCFPPDVPILNEPAAVHFIHSWSFQRPEDTETVGGRWLANGAYAFVGSTHEPGLQAFLPPSDVAARVAAGVPFLIAARHWDMPPWKVNTYGDPLMLAQRPVEAPRQRIAPDAADGADLMVVARELMGQAAADTTGDTFAKAIATLELIGKDDVAIGLWRVAVENGVPGPAARPALGPLFRKRDVAGFTAAWMELQSRDGLALDMLWHLLTPHLDTLRDRDMLIQLQSAIRRPHSYADLGRMMPALTEVFGQGHARGIVQRELDYTRNDTVRRRLNNLLK